MTLSNILKTIIKHFKKIYCIFIGIWFTIGLLLFLPFERENDYIALLYLIYLFSSFIFTLYIGITISGSYGKSFILIQNNRSNLVISSLIINIATAFIFTLITCFLRLNSNNYHFNPASFKLLFLSLSIYFLIYNIGTFYGIFFKNKPKAKKVFNIIVISSLCILGIIFIPLGIELVIFIVELDKYTKIGSILIYLNILSILLFVISTVYYLKLNIIKAYSLK